MGASERQVIILLSWLFLNLILIANLIAIPITYYLMQKWLDGFAYRIGMRYFVFVVGLGITVAVTILTTGYHTLKTARVNPLEMLVQKENKGYFSRSI